MEPHKKLPAEIERYRPDLFGDPYTYFYNAHQFAKDFYADEMQKIASVKFEEVTEDDFFREFVWVVHATGFSAKVVGSLMPRLEKAYDMHSLNWCGNKPYEEVLKKVRLVVNNPPKIKAVWTVAKTIYDEVLNGSLLWSEFKNQRLSSPEKLAQLPYIGKVTCFHLARNIGLLECVKPDLHLVRMAKRWGFKSCIEMCSAIQKFLYEDTGTMMPLGIIDLILWYSASTFGTIEIKAEGDR